MSPDLTDANIEKLVELFPTVVTETLDADGNPKRAINFDLLRQELSDHIVEGPQERYHLDWPGKRAAAFAANAPIAKTLRPVREESVDFDTTKNLFIEGDNLDALKLLQESYLGKVKLIYIDPPYNTGNDFIYADDFAESSVEYLERSRQKSESGDRLVANLESNGRFHSDWLSMIYPRLKLARNFLTADGVIAVSVDDHELATLIVILGEIFGRDQLIAVLPRLTKRAGKSGNLIAANHDYVVLWARSPEVELRREEHSDSGFKYEDQYIEERGRYKLNQTLDYGSIQYSASLDYEIDIEGAVIRPGGVSAAELDARRKRNPKTGWCWRWSRELFEFGLQNGFVVVKSGREGPRIYTKTYERATIAKTGDGYRVSIQNRTKAITSLDLLDNRFSNDMASKGIRSLFGYSAFDYTKPVELVRALVDWVISPDNEEIVLDFFAGSATTAQAVLEANFSDGGNRRFVLVQIDESVPKSSDAAARGVQTISELSRQRLRLVLEPEREKIAGATEDLGFRCLQVTPTNFRDVLTSPDSTSQGVIDDFVETVVRDATAEVILFEVLLRVGLGPEVRVETQEIAGCQVFLVEDHMLVACFEPDLPDALFPEIAKLQTLMVVVRDSALRSTSQRINAEQTLTGTSGLTRLITI